MGSEIESRKFTDADFAAFDARLKVETERLGQWFAERRFAKTGPVAGFELEAWLVDGEWMPAPVNEKFLTALASPLVVPELAAFNVEFNVIPEPLEGHALSRIQAALSELWQQAEAAARPLDVRLMMIGILPTVSDEMLTLTHMSAWERYKALNEQILRIRRGQPLKLDITSRESLLTEHWDLMLEAAATSFQIHLKVTQDEGAAVYNASKIVSAAMVAVAANSPYLFGRDLWDETRIPLFEQAVSVGHWDYAERVTFGVRYLDQSLYECFVANRQRYPVLLPAVSQGADERMHHVRLHNGTIWRWNRPLIGFDEDGAPHLRIEHRVVSAGPTMIDSIANAAFYYGMVTAMARGETPPQDVLPFSDARDNFYAAARDGLRSEVRWSNGAKGVVRELILSVLLPLAEHGLLMLDLDGDEIAHYLGIIADRTRSGQNGATWQRRYVAKHKADMPELCAAYLEHQRSGQPVHAWSI